MREDGADSPSGHPAIAGALLLLTYLRLWIVVSAKVSQ
jgi:membrane-associated phospholipid phosphatase